MIVTFAVGNSDDKLPQASWSAFVLEVHAAVDDAVLSGGWIQFAGYSPPGAPWQNALWAVQFPDGDNLRVVDDLRRRLGVLAGRYRQDSIAWWTAGRAEMIAPAGAGR